MKFNRRQITLMVISLTLMRTLSAQLNITQILPQHKQGQGTEVHVMFDDIPPHPQSFQLENPQRLVLDFKKTKHLLAAQSVLVASPEVSTIEVSKDQERTRLTVNLKAPQRFSHRVEGKNYILKINPVDAATAQNFPVLLDSKSTSNSRITSNSKTTSNLKTIPHSNSAVSAQGIKQIDFQRGSQGEGLVVIDLLAKQTPVDIQQQGDKVLIRVLNHPLAAHLIQRLNVQDFATPVSSIDAYNDANNAVIRIQSLAQYEYMAYQTDQELMISIKPSTVNSGLKAAQHTQTYTGQKLSLDFQDIEIRRVLQVLADFTGINVVAADSVQGNITLRLKNVPWDQALDLILKSKGLDKRRNGNAIWIAPVTELLKSEEDEAKLMAQSVKTAVIHTEYIQLKYAKAIDIEKLVSRGKTTNNSASSNSSGTAESTKAAAVQEALIDNNASLLSYRGSVSIDPRTNTLILSDTAQKIEQLRKLIELLDVSVKQVMIEARIVRASTDFSKEMGVKWGLLSRGNDLHVGGSDSTLWDLRTPERNSTTGQLKYTIRRPDNLNVDLGVSTQGASSIAFGLINLSNFMLDLELSALQADGYGEVISTPKVMTADKQKARVASGQQVPYQTHESGTAGTTTTTSFKDALLSLDVTPSITPDGRVQMQLNISSDSPGGMAANGNLIINKNEINTNVLVNNGETVVLGGIFEQDTRNKQTKVPLLGDIPVLGRLFRRDEKTDKKSELLIFVTPRIVNDSLTRNH